MSVRSLNVFINNELIGELRDENGIWAFGYTLPWNGNTNRFALSPHLPLSITEVIDQSSIRPVQWYFDNLLPEEGQRVLAARDANVDINDALGLLGYYGIESAGSITLLPPGIEKQTSGSLRQLSFQDLNERIRNLPNIALNHGAANRMSLAGAQHKLAVVFQENAIFEPVGAIPSTHILKPNHPSNDYPHSVINEWFTMKLAKKVGLLVPEVHRRYVPSPVYIINRFDRRRDNNGWQRIHAIDACQLLGLDRSFKYSQGSVNTLASIANNCRSPAVVRARLFQWLVFNVLIGNTDAHLKNLSFIVSHEGIQLSQHYDLLSTATYETRAFDKDDWPDKTKLAWPVMDAIYMSDIDKGLMLRAGVSLGLSERTAAQLLGNMTKIILPHAESLYDEFSLMNADLIKTNPELAPTLAGESRCLRAIIHTVIKEMTAKFI